MKNSEFSTTILREIILCGRYYHPGDTAQVNAEIFRELVAIFAADPKDRPRRYAGTKSTARRSH
jgi:myo-inositol catabolism protein IolC